MNDITPFEYFICGGFGGICTVLSGHPFDTIKVRLQTMPKPSPGKEPLYTGMIDCIRKTVEREGVSGFYKGMTAPLLTIAPVFAISFMGYKFGKQLVGPADERQFTYMDYFLSGAFSGFLTAVIMAPGERVKCLLQIQGDSKLKTYDGPLDVVIKLYKEGGIRSIYRGTLATIVRDVPASGGYYMVYQSIQNYLTDYGRTNVSLYGTVFAGGCAGTANWILGMPSDVVKSRLQAAPEGTYPKGARDVVVQLLKQEGPLAFYKGIVPVFVRAFPANASCFLGFEACKLAIRTLFPP